MTARQLALVSLLERYHELVDPMQAGNQGDRLGYLAMPLTYTPSVRELERLLNRMRNQAKQQAYKGCSLGKLRWHLMAWYVDPVTVQRRALVGFVKGDWQPLLSEQG